MVVVVDVPARLSSSHRLGGWVRPCFGAGITLTGYRYGDSLKPISTTAHVLAFNLHGVFLPSRSLLSNCLRP